MLPSRSRMYIYVLTRVQTTSSVKECNKGLRPQDEVGSILMLSIQLSEVTHEDVAFGTLHGNLCHQCMNVVVNVTGLGLGLALSSQQTGKALQKPIYHFCEGSVMCLMETWLHDNTLDSIVFYCDFSWLSGSVDRQELQREWQEARMHVWPLLLALIPQVTPSHMTLHPNAIIAI